MNRTLLGKRVFADKIKLKPLERRSSCIIRGGPKPRDRCPYRRWSREDTDIAGEGHVKMAAETGVCGQHQRTPVNSTEAGRGRGGFSAGGFRRSIVLMTPRRQTSEPQNYKDYMSIVLSHEVCSNFTVAPGTNTHSMPHPLPPLPTEVLDSHVEVKVTFSVCNWSHGWGSPGAHLRLLDCGAVRGPCPW